MRLVHCLARRAGITSHVVIALAILCSGFLTACGTEHAAPAPLRPSGNGHYLVTPDGRPFVIQADTAWALPERSTREDVVKYLDARQKQGFNIVMVAATFDFGKGVNAYGQTVWDGDASKPNPKFFDHVDFIVQQAEERGMLVALFPVWLRHVTPPLGSGLTLDNAYEYGRWIGHRYRHHSIIWVMGGDDPNWHEAITRALARGVTKGVTGSDTDNDGVTMTYHAATSSMEKFHNDAWLDFNMVQSGHCGDNLAAGNVLTTAGFDRVPAKPIIDAEPYYEGHPLCWDPRKGYSTAQQVRNGLYNGVFGGGCGIAYGHHSVWQMYQPGRVGANGPLSYWYDALHAEAAADAQHLRRLLESRPILMRVPDGGSGSGTAGIRYTKAYDGSYLMGYSTDGRSLTIDLDTLSGDNAQLWWFDPRTGQATNAGKQTSNGVKTMKPPSNQDWVFVADDAANGYAAPGDGAL